MLKLYSILLAVQAWIGWGAGAGGGASAPLHPSIYAAERDKEFRRFLKVSDFSPILKGSHYWTLLKTGNCISDQTTSCFRCGWHCSTCPWRSHEVCYGKEDFWSSNHETSGILPPLYSRKKCGNETLLNSSIKYCVFDAFFYVILSALFVLNQTGFSVIEIWTYWSILYFKSN